MLNSPVHKASTSLLCLPFAAGILLQQHYNFELSQSLSVLIILCCLFLILQFFRIQRYSFINKIQLWLFILSFAVLGSIRYNYSNQTPDFEKIKSSNYLATVLTVPAEKKSTYKLILCIDSVNAENKSQCCKTKVITYLEKTPRALSLLPGDVIHFNGTLDKPPQERNPEDFNYCNFLSHRSIYATSYLKDANWQLTNKHKTSIKIAAALVQNHIVKLLSAQPFEEPELAVLSALTVGYKQLIDDDQRQAYSCSGATHILAVSGLHVGIIFIFLSRLFKIIGRNKYLTWPKTLLIILMLWTFAFITGLSPSVCRATLMFSLISLGNVGKQHSSIFNTVFISAFILLFLNPHLIFELGFQLSYTAVLGILTFQPLLVQILHSKLHLYKPLAELISVSIAAQIGTAPITIHIFNTFPLYFIITNVWIIPLVGFIVNGAIILIILCLLHLPCSFITIPLNWLLKGMNYGVNVISQFWHSQFTNLYINNFQAITLYIFLILLLIAIAYHSKRYLFCCSITLIIFCFFNLNQAYRQYEKQGLFIFYDKNSFNICTQQGNQGVILYENDTTMLMPAYYIHHRLSNKHLTICDLQTEGQDCNIIKQKDFIIAGEDLHCIYSPQLEKYAKDFSVKSLIINTEEPNNIYNFYDTFSFEELVLFRNPEKHINYYRHFCQTNNVKLHVIYKDGAYITGW